VPIDSDLLRMYVLVLWTNAKIYWADAYSNAGYFGFL